jgi:hypothetical protein
VFYWLAIPLGEAAAPAADATSNPYQPNDETNYMIRSRAAPNKLGDSDLRIGRYLHLAIRLLIRCHDLGLTASLRECLLFV